MSGKRRPPLGEQLGERAVEGMSARREQVKTLLSAAAERVSTARWAVVRALAEARYTSGAGWQDKNVQHARDEFIQAGAAHAAARQLLRDLDTAGALS